jgi:hypothetical protein
MKVERTADDADDAAFEQGLTHSIDIETSLEVRRRPRILLILRSNQH